MSLKDKWPWLLLAAAVFVSSLYEYGYWSVFDFNSFEYFSIESLIKNFAYVVMSGFRPVMVATVLSFLPGIMREYFGGRPQGTSKGLIAELREAYPTAFTVIETLLLFGAYGILYALKDYRHLQDIPENAVLGVISLIALYVSLDESFARMGSRLMRASGVGFTLAYCWIAVSTGRRDALAVLNGESFFYVNLSAEEQKDVGTARAKYIGALGDAYAFTTLDNQRTFLIRKDHMPTLRLEKSKKKMGDPR